jgi:hypothetical protein
MHVRWRKSGARTRLRSTMRSPPIFPVPRRGSATACCCVWRDATPRRGSCSTNCCFR